ncbi:MAG: response regulator [Ignavibacteriales bacterium]|nr:response regulator [Ignavibacteriales bacterium]
MDNSQKKILIVEDEVIVAMEIEMHLQMNNFIVVGKCQSSEKAIELSLDKRPDLIMMDINIQGEKDGVQTAKIILDTFKPSILFLSAYNDANTIERIKQIPDSNLLPKPFSVHELLTAINSYFVS